MTSADASARRTRSSFESIGPVFWTLVPEIFPNDVRGNAMIVPVLIQWGANAMAVLLFPYAFHVVGKAITLGFLALMSLAQGIFTWLYVPETKNKRLEEIEDYWITSKRVASVVRTEVRKSIDNRRAGNFTYPRSDDAPE